MSTYRVEWPCCNSVTETDCWEPQRCPFCEPDIPDGGVVRVLKTIGPLPPPSPDIIPPLEAALPDDAPAAPDDAERALRIRNLIAEREFNTACANRELTQFGEWRWDHEAADREIEAAIARLLAPDGAVTDDPLTCSVCGESGHARCGNE